jgi:hypothetical protein
MTEEILEYLPGEKQSKREKKMMARFKCGNEGRGEKKQVLYGRRRKK